MRVGVLTSGGDAPGMNAAIRAVVRSAADKGWETVGIRRGYAGLIEGDVTSLGVRAVGGIIQQGGTVLGSARCPQFKTKEGRAEALESLRKNRVDALVVIGGNGSQTGAHSLHQMGFPVVGIASTIDNDLYGSEITIGVDSALNIALEAIDRLKITASSHHRAFLVEVMGRNCGYLALMTAIAGGAEAVLIPESEMEPDDLAEEIRTAYERGKAHAIVVVAEGCASDAQRLAEHFSEHRDRLGFELRLTILGHVQRGGAPGAFDRLLATRLAVAATEQLDGGNAGVLLGLLRGDIVPTPLAEVVEKQKPLDLELLRVASVLAR